MDDKLKQETIKVLEDIINGCVHPEKALRRISVELAPIRKILIKLRTESVPIEIKNQIGS